MDVTSLLQWVPVPTKLIPVMRVSPPGTPVTPPVPAGQTIPFGSFYTVFITSCVIYTPTPATMGVTETVVIVFFVVLDLIELGRACACHLLRPPPPLRQLTPPPPPLRWLRHRLLPRRGLRRRQILLSRHAKTRCRQLLLQLLSLR